MPDLDLAAHQRGALLDHVTLLERNVDEWIAATLARDYQAFVLLATVVLPRLNGEQRRRLLKQMLASSPSAAVGEHLVEDMREISAVRNTVAHGLPMHRHPSRALRDELAFQVITGSGDYEVRTYTTVELLHLTGKATNHIQQLGRAVGHLIRELPGADHGIP